MMVDLGKDSLLENCEIKLLESFSLPSNISNTKTSTVLPKMKPELIDEHCDHTYSIASSIAYKQTHDLTKYSDNLLLKTQLSATVIKTGEFTMKIVKNIPAVIPETPNPIGSESISLINNPLSHRTAFLETETSNIMHTRSKTKNSRLIHVIQPSDFCVNCNQDLCSSMGNAVFCLKTGNVTVTCSTCSSTMSVKGAFKLPKSI